MDPLKRSTEGRLSQAYGIYGFVMMHYWFSDHAVMDETLQAMLKDGQPDTKFCLMWANEAWTRRYIQQSMFRNCSSPANVSAKIRAIIPLCSP